MVSPVTNCSPIIRIATSTALRMMPRPLRANKPVKVPDKLFCFGVSISLPVNMRPHAAALTNIKLLWPTCSFQLPWLILSLINRSRVAISGIRSNASAKHISAMPSWEDSANSCKRPCTIPALPLPLLRSRKVWAKSNASSWMRWFISSEILLWSNKFWTQSVSARRQAVLISTSSSLFSLNSVIYSNWVWASLKCVLLSIIFMPTSCAYNNVLRDL